MLPRVADTPAVAEETIDQRQNIHLVCVLAVSVSSERPPLLRESGDHKLLRDVAAAGSWPNLPFTLPGKIGARGWESR